MSEQEIEKKYPVQQSAAFASGTAITMTIIDLFGHLGSTGLLVAGITSYVAWRHGPELYEQVRGLLPAPAQAEQPESVKQHPQQRSWLDRALGRHPESELTPAEAAAEDTIVVPEEDSEEHVHNAANAPAMVGYAARDPRLALSLAPRFRPDVNLFLREGIFACGCKGSGKTGVLAKLIEQIMRIAEQVDPARRGIPGVVLDKEGDLLSLLEVLPNGRIADQQHWYSAAEIIEQQLQVVVNLQAWLKDEERAAVIVYLANDLIQYTGNQEPSQRLPCPVFLDEAQYWLPQESVSYLTRETQRQLIDTFTILLSTGRKRGLTPFIFTQRIAQIDKSTISLGIQIFMRQIIDNDSRRCMEYIRSDVIDDKKNLATLAEGQGVVCLPGGVQLLIQFDERQSTHLSHAPTVERVLAHSAQVQSASPSYHQPALPYQPPAYRSTLPEQIAHQSETVLGMSRASDSQPGVAAQAHMENGSTRGADRTQHFTKTLGPELQAAYDAFRPGMHHHTLARALGTTPAVAGHLLKQLQMCGLIDAAGNKTVASPQVSQEDLRQYDRVVAVWHELEGKKCANVRDFAAAMHMGETNAWELLTKLDRLGLIHWERRKKRDVV